MPKPDKGPRGQKINGVVEFDPVGPISAYGESFMVKGSGYPAESLVHVSAADPGCCLAFNVGTDENGEFVILWISGAPGTYRFTAFAGEPRRSGKWDYYGFGVIEVVE